LSQLAIGAMVQQALRSSISRSSSFQCARGFCELAAVLPAVGGVQLEVSSPVPPRSSAWLRTSSRSYWGVDMRWRLGLSSPPPRARPHWALIAVGAKLSRHGAARRRSLAHLQATQLACRGSTTRLAGHRIQTFFVGEQKQQVGNWPGTLQLLSDHRRGDPALELGCLEASPGSSLGETAGPTVSSLARVSSAAAAGCGRAGAAFLPQPLARFS